MESREEIKPLTGIVYPWQPNFQRAPHFLGSMGSRMHAQKRFTVSICNVKTTRKTIPFVLQTLAI